MGQVEEINRCQRADEMQRGQLDQRQAATRPDGAVGSDHGLQVRNEPVDILGRHHRGVVTHHHPLSAGGSTVADA